MSTDFHDPEKNVRAWAVEQAIVIGLSIANVAGILDNARLLESFVNNTMPATTVLTPPLPAEDAAMAVALKPTKRVKS